jgi:VanZ family protein
VSDWVAGHEPVAGLPIGFFGASTGASAALVAAAARPETVAVVSRGGRPDLAGADLRSVHQPTLLIRRRARHVVLDLNRQAMEELAGEVALEVVPAATHLFEEPGALEEVARLARDWFVRHHGRWLPTAGWVTAVRLPVDRLSPPTTTAHLPGPRLRHGVGRVTRARPGGGHTGPVSRAPVSTAARRMSPLGPGGRPFAGWRPAVALLGVGAMLATAVLLMSDRAPGLLRRLSSRIDSGSSRAARLAAETRPQSDFEIHILVWAGITVLVGLAMWSSRSLLVSAVAVLALSVGAERAQLLVTSTREMQLGDLVANTIGVLTGLGVVSGLSILMGWKDPDGQLVGR